MFSLPKMTSYIVPAKLNLLLRVFHKLPNGYHQIESLISRISLADKLRISLTPGKGQVKISCSYSKQLAEHIEALDRVYPDYKNNISSILNDPEKNIAAKAASLFFMRSPSSRVCDVHIELLKHVPPAAGLGGGSADAAAVLLCLKSEFGDSANVSNKDIHEIASNLGSDIPALLYKGLIFMQGTGSKLSPVKALGRSTGGERHLDSLFRAGLLILRPPLVMETPLAYEALNRGFAEFEDSAGCERAVIESAVNQIGLGLSIADKLSVIDPEALSGDLFAEAKVRAGNRADYRELAQGEDFGLFKQLCSAMINDFEPVVVVEDRPLLSNARELLYNSGASRVLLCGSGSAQVGFFPNLNLAKIAEAKLSTFRDEGWYVESASFLEV